MTTLFDELADAGLPVISADDNGHVVMGEITTEQQVIFSDVMRQHFDHGAFVIEQADKTDAKTIRERPDQCAGRRSRQIPGAHAKVATQVPSQVF